MLNVELLHLLHLLNDLYNCWMMTQLLNELYNIKCIMYYGHIIFVFMINVYMN